MGKPRKASALEGETRGSSPAADAHQIYMLARLETSVSMQTGARKVNVGHLPVQTLLRLDRAVVGKGDSSAD
jgi:hypothetical protein